MTRNTDAAAETTRDPPSPRVRIRERVRGPAEGDVLPAVPPHLAFLLEERPLLPGEQSDEYDRLQRTIIAQVTPTDAIEVLWAKDVVDLIWEATRYRRWRNRIIAQERQRSAAACILPVCTKMSEFGLGPDVPDEARAERLAAGWLKGDERETAAFTEKLAQLDLTPADVTAHAFQSRLAEVERVERMIASADHRRDALLREIVRKRATLGNQLRDAAAEVIDYESSAPTAAAAARPSSRT